MGNKDHIKALLKEAEVYHNQGFLDESKEKYQEILDTVKTSDDLSKNTHFMDFVHNKIHIVESTLCELDSEPDTIKLPEEVQGLISNLFSFSENEDIAALESAMALATFGQYEKALSEFQKLIDKKILPITVAKNMLQCHLALATHEAAISQLEHWISDRTFIGEELSFLRDFLENILGRDGIKADLPKVDNASSGGEIAENIEEGVSEKDISAILSIKVILDNKHMKEQIRDFDIIFQLGTSVIINVKNSEKDLLSFLESGVRLSKIQCYASFYYFNAKGVVSEKRMITAGPNHGDYSIRLILGS